MHASDYLGIDRMKLLLLSQHGNPALILLLDGRKLLENFANGGVFKRRQDMERDLSEVEKLLADFAIDGRRPFRVYVWGWVG